VVSAEKSDGLHSQATGPIRASACARFIFTMKTGLLKPAYHGANGYRSSGGTALDPQQSCQPGAGVRAEANQTNPGRADFEKVAALQSHREVLRRTSPDADVD